MSVDIVVENAQQICFTIDFGRVKMHCCIAIDWSSQWLDRSDDWNAWQRVKHNIELRQANGRLRDDVDFVDAAVFVIVQ